MWGGHLALGCFRGYFSSRGVCETQGIPCGLTFEPREQLLSSDFFPHLAFELFSPATVTPHELFMSIVRFPSSSEVTADGFGAKHQGNGAPIAFASTAFSACATAPQRRLQIPSNTKLKLGRDNSIAYYRRKRTLKALSYRTRKSLP